MPLTTDCPPVHPTERIRTVAILPPNPPIPAKRNRWPTWLAGPGRRLVRGAVLVALGLVSLNAFPELSIAFLLSCFFGLPVMLAAAVLAMLADGWQFLHGRPKRTGWGSKQALQAAGLCLIGCFCFMPTLDMSPVMLDLHGRGVIGTTGSSTAKHKSDHRIGHTVSFDLAATGRPQQVEWSNGDGAGFLVDDRDGGATLAARTDGVIDGSRLFGDQGGRYVSGFDKLATLDTDHDGRLSGAELYGLKVWIDNGDARIQPGELKSLAELGITDLDVTHQAVSDSRGEVLDRSGFTQNGQRKMSEDVWFGQSASGKM